MWFPLEILIIGLALVLALVGVVRAVARRPRLAAYRPLLQLLQAVLVGQALVAGLLVLRGHRPDELITFGAYAVTSLVVVPILLTLLASPDEEYGGPVWPNVLVAIAGVAVAVIVLRMGATWPAAGA